jgi:hypothetical protein
MIERAIHGEKVAPLNGNSNNCYDDHNASKLAQSVETQDRISSTKLVSFCSLFVEATLDLEATGSTTG